MRPRILRLRTLLGIACLCCLATVANAEGFAAVGNTIRWDNLFNGARSEAMGQSDMAAGRGPMVTLNNAAPLPEGQMVQVGYGNMDYLTGLWFNHYGVAAELGEFRLGYAQMDFRSDSIEVRTAFNPEGPGETFAINDRVQVLSAGMNVAKLLVPETNWDWTVGAAYRRYSSTFDGTTSRSGGIDFGSSGRFQTQGAGARFTGSAAGAMENVFKKGWSPRRTRFGLALTMAVDAEDNSEVLALTLAYTWLDDRSAEEYFESRHYGLELTLLRSVSFRLGHDKLLFEGSDQYGFGIVVPRQWIKPFGLTFDWASMGKGDATGFFADGAPGNMISVTATLAI